MPRNLHYHQKECTNLHERISDEETYERFDAAMEIFWNDIPSLIELADDMREELKLQRDFK